MAIGFSIDVAVDPRLFRRRRGQLQDKMGVGASISIGADGCSYGSNMVVGSELSQFGGYLRMC